MGQIDSKKESLLSLPVVVLKAIEQGDLRSLTPAAVIASILKQASMENGHIVQYGNTVFIGNTNKSGNLVYGRAFNVDTPKNFMSNGVHYLKYLMKKGVKKYISVFNNPAIASAFKHLEKSPLKDQISVRLARSQSKPDLLIARIDFENKEI